MINKEKNVNVQITLSKESFNKLENIVKDLSKNQILALNKSQAIEFLIKNYSLRDVKLQENKNKAKKQAKENYSKRLKDLALKKGLGISQLARELKINVSTFKKYYYGENEPTNANKMIIDKALEENGL